MKQLQLGKLKEIPTGRFNGLAVNLTGGSSLFKCLLSLRRRELKQGSLTFWVSTLYAGLRVVRGPSPFIPSCRCVNSPGKPRSSSHAQKPPTGSDSHIQLWQLGIYLSQSMNCSGAYLGDRCLDTNCKPVVCIIQAEDG